MRRGLPFVVRLVSLVVGGCVMLFVICVLFVVEWCCRLVTSRVFICLSFLRVVVGRMLLLLELCVICSVLFAVCWLQCVCLVFVVYYCALVVVCAFLFVF